MSVNQWHWSDAASVYLCHQSALRTTSPQHIGFMQHWGHCSWNVFEGLDLMSQPQEEQKVGRLGLSISPSDIWWTGGFPIMTRFTSNRLRFSSQRNQLRWKNKAREREGHPPVCGEKRLQYTAPCQSQWNDGKSQITRAWIILKQMER